MPTFLAPKALRTVPLKLYHCGLEEIRAATIPLSTLFLIKYIIKNKGLPLNPKSHRLDVAIIRKKRRQAMIANANKPERGFLK